MSRRDRSTELPRIRRWLMSGFEKHYLPRFLRRNFHVIACNRSQLTNQLARSTIDGQTALVLYCNHASWWDPMLAIYLRTQIFPAHRLYAPIDAAALEKYQVFKSMGFYGVANSHRGAAEFLHRSMQILKSPGASIWLTPEGKFCDPRKVDEPLQPGLAHLAHTIERSSASASLPNIWFIPAAIEYVFWEERYPECLIWFGEPLQVHWQAAEPSSKEQWQARLTSQLRHSQQQLATASIHRDTTPFELLLTRKSSRSHSKIWRNLAQHPAEGR